MTKYILDASALLTLLNNEKGAERVSQLLPDAMMSSINLSECIAVLNLVGVPETQARDIFTELIPNIESFDTEQAYACANLRALTKDKGLSLGDRACLALGKLKGLPVITADKAWKKVDCGVLVELIR